MITPTQGELVRGTENYVRCINCHDWVNVFITRFGTYKYHEVTGMRHCYVGGGLIATTPWEYEVE